MSLPRETYAILHEHHCLLQRLKENPRKRRLLEVLHELFCAHFFLYFIHTHTNTYTHTHIHIFTHTLTHTYIHSHTHTYTQTHTNTYTLIHTQIYSHIYTHTQTHTYKHIYTHTHTYTHTCTHSQTHTHALTHTLRYTYTHIHTYTPSHTYKYTHTHTNTHMHTHIHSHTLTYTYTNSHTQYTHTVTCTHTKHLTLLHASEQLEISQCITWLFSPLSRVHFLVVNRNPIAPQVAPQPVSHLLPPLHPSPLVGQPPSSAVLFCTTVHKPLLPPRVHAVTV